MSLFRTLEQERSDLHSAIGRRVRGRRSLSTRIRDEIWNHHACIITGFVNDTAPYYTAFDLLLFPSHREGLPNVPLEAAAAGRPTAGFAATGTVDAVRNGESRNARRRRRRERTHRCRSAVLVDQVLLARHGQEGGPARAYRFRREVIWQELADLYRKELGAHGLPVPDKVLRKVA